jgi:hypothetical protein
MELTLALEKLVNEKLHSLHGVSCCHMLVYLQRNIYCVLRLRHIYRLGKCMCRYKLNECWVTTCNMLLL